MSDRPKSCHQVKMSHFLMLSALKHASDACVCVLQEKQSEMERLKEQLVEVEKQRDELNNTIGKLRQVKMNFRSGGFLIIIMRSEGSVLRHLQHHLFLMR